MRNLFKELIICEIVSVFAFALMAFISNSQIGFSQQTLGQSSTALRDLMLLMMDYKSIAYIGIPSGFLFWGLLKLMRINIAKECLSK